MNLIARCVLLACAASTFGCETMQQQAIGPDPSQACFAQISSMPSVQPIMAKVGPAPNASLSMKSDSSKPTPEEKKAVLAWDNERRRCFELGRDFRAKYAPPTWSSTFEVQQAQFSDLMGELYQGKITYGEFNTRRTANYASANAAMSAALEQDKAGAMNKQMARSAVAQQQMANTAATLSILNQSRPAFAPPAPDINCTSQRFGAQIQTRCN